MDMYDVEVTAVRDLSPHLRRVTLRSEQLRTFRDDGPDQRFKLLLPRAGQSAPVLPDHGPQWYQAWQAMDPEARPVMRTYTIRAARPEAGEVDVDLVLHGETGPASRWAVHARPGDRVGLYAAYAEYEVAAGSRQLIVGDHTALPAVAAICERMDGASAARAETVVIIEVNDPADQVSIDGPAGLAPVWVIGSADRPGAAMTDAVTVRPDLTWDYAWVAGEQSAVAGLRRHLITSRGLTAEQIMFMGYWKLGAAIDEN